jgi:hypothetical protein
MVAEAFHADKSRLDDRGNNEEDCDYTQKQIQTSQRSPHMMFI